MLESMIVSLRSNADSAPMLQNNFVDLSFLWAFSFIATCLYLISSALKILSERLRDFNVKIDGRSEVHYQHCLVTHHLGRLTCNRNVCLRQKSVQMIPDLPLRLLQTRLYGNYYIVVSFLSS